jgi:hypothetical protein
MPSLQNSSRKKQRLLKQIHAIYNANWPFICQIYIEVNIYISTQKCWNIALKHQSSWYV